MQAISQNINKITTNQLIYILSILAGIFTWRVMDIRNDWINVDSILYLDSAKAMLQGDWQEAYQIFRWPFYSALIASVAKITNIEVFAAAKILNILFFGITIFSLLKIVDLIKSEKLALFSLVLLLLGSRYIGGSVLPMLLRDEGFWACLTTATFFLIKFLPARKSHQALLWQVTITLATLFRIEGAIYLVALPIVIFWQENDKRIAFTDFLRLNSLFIVGLGCVAVTLPFLEIPIESIGRLNELQPKYFFGSVAQLFIERSQAMQPILGELLAEYDELSLAVSLFFITLVKMLSAVSLPTLLIMVIYNKNRPILQNKLLPKHISLVFVGILAIVFLTSLASISRSFVLSGRYLIPLTFFSGILASVMLASVMRRYALIKRTHQVILVIVLVVFSLQFFKNIWSKPANYNYIKVSVDYLQQKNIASDDVAIFSRKAAFYSHKKEIDVRSGCDSDQEWMCITNQIKKNHPSSRYILLPVDVGRDTHKVLEFLNEELADYKIIQEISNPKKDKKIIILEKIN